MRYYLVDRISEVEAGRRIRGLKNVAMTEDYLEYHFPRQPTVPGVLLLEALAQLGGWLEAASSGFDQWFLIENIRQCKFYRFARPGDQVELTVEVVPGETPGRRAYRGVGSVAGQRRVVAEFEGAVVPLADLEDPAEHRALFEILSRGSATPQFFEGTPAR